MADASGPGRLGDRWPIFGDSEVSSTGATDSQTQRVSNRSISDV